jgi:putative transcription antitermination factor YqgF
MTKLFGIGVLAVLFISLISHSSIASHLQINYARHRCDRRNAKSVMANYVHHHLAFVSPPTIQSPRCPRTKIKLLTAEETHQEIFTTPKLTAAEEHALTTKFSKLRSLGIDYGLIRTGLAVTTGGYRPRPLGILSGYTKQYTLRNVTKIKEITGTENATVNGIDNTRLIEAIVSMAQSEQVTNLVLGLPLHKNGSISEQSNITQQFGVELLEHLRKECGNTMNVTLWDERYTSKEAASRIVGEMMARNRDLSSIDLEGCLDDEAACIILEHYYQVLGKDAQVLTLDDATEEECRRLYEAKIVQREQERIQIFEDREKMWNARREMIKRDRLLMEENDGSGGGKKKKKRKKKK